MKVKKNLFLSILLTGALLTGACGQERKGGTVEEEADRKKATYIGEEKEIGLPKQIMDGTEMINGIVKEKEGGFRVYTAAKGKKGCLVSYSFHEGKWNRQEEAWTDKPGKCADQNRITVFKGEDGNDYAWYIAAGEIPHIVRKTGSMACEEIEIPAWKEKIAGTDYVILPEQVGVLKNGNIVMTSAQLGICTVYEKARGYEILEEMDYIDAGNLNCFENEIFGNMKKISDFTVYDSAKKKTILEADNEKYEFSAFCRTEKGIFYACGKDGLYRLRKNKWEKCFSGSGTMLADPSVHAAKLFEEEGVFYIFYKNLRNEDLHTGLKYGFRQYRMKKLSQKEQEEREKNTFTIWALEENETVNYAVRLMQNRYPNLVVSLETASENNAGAAVLSDEIRSLNAEMVSGGGPDILILDGMDSKNYTDKKLLKPLNHVIGQKEDLNENIIRPFRLEKGRIYEIPVRFQVPVVFSSSKELTDAEDLDTLNRYIKQKRNIPLLPELTMHDALDIVCRFFETELFGEGQKITEEMLEKFLENLREFCEKIRIVEKTKREFSYTDEEPWDALLFGEAELVVKNVSGTSDVQSVLDAALQCGGGYHIAGGNFIPVCRAAVSVNTKFETEAEEFIKLLLSEEVQEQDFSDGFPVSDNAMNAWGGYQSSMSTMISNGTVEISAGCAEPEEIRAFLEEIKKADRKWIPDETVIAMVKKNAEEYLEGKKGKNETIKSIQNTLTLRKEE